MSHCESDAKNNLGGYYIELIKYKIKFQLTYKQYHKCRDFSRWCETKDWTKIDYDRRYWRVRFSFKQDGIRYQETQMVLTRGMRPLVNFLKDITRGNDPRYRKLIDAAHDMRKIDSLKIHSTLSELHTRLLRLECNLLAPNE